MSTPEQYADAVTIELAVNFDLGPADMAGTALYTTQTIRRAVAEHVRKPDRSFSVIVDSPSVANWVLAPDPDDVRRVVLVCRRYTRPLADTAREDRVNAKLRALSL